MPEILGDSAEAYRRSGPVLILQGKNLCGFRGLASALGAAAGTAVAGKDVGSSCARAGTASNKVSAAISAAPRNEGFS